MDDESSKLVDCGIALLEKSNSKKYVVVSEPLAIETVNTVLNSQYERPDDALLQRLIAELLFVMKSQILQKESHGNILLKRD